VSIRQRVSRPAFGRSSSCLNLSPSVPKFSPTLNAPSAANYCNRRLVNGSVDRASGRHLLVDSWVNMERTRPRVYMPRRLHSLRIALGTPKKITWRCPDITVWYKSLVGEAFVILMTRPSLALCSSYYIYLFDSLCRKYSLTVHYSNRTRAHHSTFIP
jgi:hypothetical protein